jgi:hypothetical protein
LSIAIITPEKELTEEQVNSFFEALFFQAYTLMNFEASASCVVGKPPRLNMEPASRRDATLFPQAQYHSPRI